MPYTPFEIESIPLSEKGDLILRVGRFSIIFDQEGIIRGILETGKIMKVERESDLARIVGEEGSFEISNLPETEDPEYLIEQRKEKIIVKDSEGPVMSFTPEEEISAYFSSGSYAFLGTRSPYFYIFSPPYRFLGTSFPVCEVFDEKVLYGRGRYLIFNLGEWERPLLGNVLKVKTSSLIYTILSSGILQAYSSRGDLVVSSIEPGIIDVVPTEVELVKIYKYGVKIGEKMIKGYFRGGEKWENWIAVWDEEKIYFIDERGKVRRKIITEEEPKYVIGSPKAFFYLTKYGAYYCEKKPKKIEGIEDPAVIEVFHGGYCLANLRGEYLYYYEGERFRGRAEEPILGISREGDRTYLFGIRTCYLLRRGKIVREIPLL